MGHIIAVIPARGGSKGIPDKNLRLICGKPLLAWSILQANASKVINSVWVSSDSSEILAVAKEYGANIIKRPAELSGDTSSSEVAWLHALKEIECAGVNVDYIIGMQATSPIREASDLDAAIELVRKEMLDSLLTVTEVEDFFNWRIGINGPEAVNYDYKSRKMRQLIEKRFLENGSFYIFRPEILRSFNNRLGGKIGMYTMERHKMFQIDNPEDILLCESIMRGYGLNINE
jgi:CMP-N,N'-diacetyllegionaminic acid synthase